MFWSPNWREGKSAPGCTLKTNAGHSRLHISKGHRTMRGEVFPVYSLKEDFSERSHMVSWSEKGVS